MTQAREPDDRDRAVDRELIRLNRRLTRLEDSQVTGRELSESFGRVYDEIDALEDQINQRFDNLEARLDLRFDTLDAKFEVIMRHLTGQGN
jgi:hypothetical protein